MLEGLFEQLFGIGLWQKDDIECILGFKLKPIFYNFQVLVIENSCTIQKDVWKIESRVKYCSWTLNLSMQILSSTSQRQTMRKMQKTESLFQQRHSNMYIDSFLPDPEP